MGHKTQLHAQKMRSKKCGTCAGRLAAPSHSAAFLCFFGTVHSYGFLLFHTIFPVQLSSRNTFMTAGSLTNSFASSSMHASLPMINSLKKATQEPFLDCSISVPSLISLLLLLQEQLLLLSAFLQGDHPSRSSVAGQQAKTLFYLSFLFYCCSKTKTK